MYIFFFAKRRLRPYLSGEGGPSLKESRDRLDVDSKPLEDDGRLRARALRHPARAHAQLDKE